jgi:hypothetical protein
MACVNNQDFYVNAGATFHPTVRWGSDQLSAVPVQAIAQAAPAVITAPGHNVPPGWPVAVVSAQGMPQINATRYPPQGSDWRRATVLDAARVSLNSVNSADFTEYTTGGFLVYNAPMPLVGVAAHMAIYDNPDRTGVPIATLTTGSGITVDSMAMTIIPELQTAGLTWRIGYYELDMTDAAGIVTRILTGTITID